MQVSVEILEGLSRRVTVTVPMERYQEAYKKQINDLSKRVKLDGFRSGKVPLAEVERRYGKAVHQEVLEDLLRSTFPEVMKQENLRPVDYPKIEMKQTLAGKPFEYVLTFDVYPKIELIDLSDTETEKVIVDVADEDINTMVDNLLKQRCDWVAVERAAKNDDRVTIDFEGFLDGEAFEGGKAEKFDLVLGSKQMIPGFEEGIVNAKPGDELEINVTFPEEYGHKPLAGKPTLFKIKVHEVAESKLPEVTADFCKSLGIEGSNLNDLRDEVQRILQKQGKESVRSVNKKEMLKRLTDVHEFELPQSLVEAEMDRLYERVKEKDKTDRESFRAEATEHVKSGLLVGEYIKKFDLKPDQARVREILADIARMQPDSAEFAESFYKDPEKRQQLEMIILEDQAVDKLFESVKVKERKVSYQDAITGKV